LEGRCSQLGHLTTDLESITSKQLESLDALLEREERLKRTLKKALTDNMKVSLAELIEKRDKPDELPPGASHLEGVFRDVFWSKKNYSIINIWIKEIYARDALRVLGIVNKNVLQKQDSSS
jgi:hypothetical protein